MKTTNSRAIITNCKTELGCASSSEFKAAHGLKYCWPTTVELLVELECKVRNGHFIHWKRSNCTNQNWTQYLNKIDLLNILIKSDMFPSTYLLDPVAPVITAQC